MNSLFAILFKSEKELKKTLISLVYESRLL